MELKDPRIGFVTTRRQDSTDLRQARVYVSVLGNERKREKTLEGSNRRTASSSRSSPTS